MKPKYGNNVKLCYVDTDSFIMNIQTEDFYKDIANDVVIAIGLMKDELGGKIITEFVTLRPKTYSYLTDDCKEAKGTKKMCNKNND